ncbi:MAG: GntR family transcriptional regulator [Propionibacteriaceae bacterium]|nr:GntR family transcriptional regulator [Propionibacteriaceae bacterium]
MSTVERRAGHLPTSKDLKYASLADSMRQSILAGSWPMGSKLPTEKELIAQTGLSLTTVRRAFQELVDEGLVDRKRGAGTFVAPWRSRPRQQRSSIGILTPEIRSYYNHVIRGVQDHLTSAGAGTALVATYDWDTQIEKIALDRLLDSGVDGLILAPSMPHGDEGRAVLDRLHALPVPVVLAERSAQWTGPSGRMEHVISDHPGGAYDGITHLRDLGHRRIGLVVRGGSYTSRGVTEGYHRACEDFGMSPWVRDLTGHHAASPLPPDAVVPVADDLQNSDVTAVLVFGDREAQLLQAILIPRGTRIPEDLAMVSYDDESAEFAPVPLTAIRPPKYQLGQMAAEILLRRMRSGALLPLEQVQLRPSLVVRESCGSTVQRK